MAEELDFHLFEFTTTKRVIARVNLVAKRLTDLCDAERQFKPRTIEDVLKVHENSLGCFRPQKGNGRSIFHCPDVGLEHKVELSRLSECSWILYIRTHDIS